MRIRHSSLTALAGVAALTANCATAPQQGGPAPAKTLSSPTGDAPSAPAPTARPSPASASGVMLCPKMSISNSPPVDDRGYVVGGPDVALNGVLLMIAPATNVCLSSGYGPRGDKTHRGVDYHTRTSGDVLAAGDGTILEATTRADFGAMIVIDHGAGVYTRYAHLASFSAPARQGARIRRGEILGPIGASGATSVRHLHYEILSGKYVSGVGSFGLSTHNPFGLPSP